MSRSNREPASIWHTVATTLATLTLFLSSPVLGADNEGSPWTIRSWLETGGGYEEESLVDPDLNRAAVPGGSFVNLTPRAWFWRALSPRTSLGISASGSFERYLNEEERLLFGASAWGELTSTWSSRLYSRVSLGADYFDDSEVFTANRFGANGVATLGVGGPRRAVEFFAGGRVRRYPDLVVDDDAGVPGTYDEVSTDVGLSVFGRPGRRIFLKGQLLRRSTDSRDRLFDSDSWYFKSDARVVTGRAWTTLLSGVYQQRQFDNREPGLDDDDYVQLGLRVNRWLVGRQTIGLSLSYVRYGQPDGADDSSGRVALLYSYAFGRPERSVMTPRTAASAVPEADPSVENERVVFRIQAPEARSVAVAGNFNGWDPASRPMRNLRGGLWELELRLTPGSYQYAYVVDGEWIVPADAETTIDDGYGRSNGLFVVPSG